jgi:hypothetical protein
METNTTSSTTIISTTSRIKKKIKKVLIISGIILVIIFGIIIYWNYFYTYSDGYRAGQLQKFSRKGFIFKTYEGEMILSSITTDRNVAIASEKFMFSVSDKKLASQLDTLQGRNVVVHYHQKNSTLSWRGESNYLVDSVKPQ